MKLVLSKASLQRALQVVQGIVESKSTMPILSHMLLSAGESTYISATDLDIAVREPLEATVKEPGAVCVPARKLYEIVREIPVEELELETLENNWIRLSGGKSRFKLIGLKESDFPSFPETEETVSLRFDAATLQDMIARTIYATGDSDARYTLNGLLLHLDPEAGAITLVGTDGHRLSVARKALNAGFPEERKVILPKKAASELRKLIENYEGDLELAFDRNHITFRLGDILFISRLIEGSYPNHEQVVPGGADKMLTVSRDDILGAVRRAAVVGREKTFPVKVDIDGEVAHFSSNNPDVGEAVEEVPISYEGGALSIGFNARYMIDALQNLPGEEVRMEFQDALSPTLLKQADADDFFCVIMPMRI